MKGARLDGMSNRWLLPDAVDEFLPPQAEALERLRRELLDMFFSWGYELVMPPLIEYIESLLVGTGNDLDLETFKLIDQSTGRLLGLRADITPQAARIDAHRLQRKGPQRLCYLDPGCAAPQRSASHAIPAVMPNSMAMPASRATSKCCA